jgi:hypothetical protein
VSRFGLLQLVVIAIAVRLAILFILPLNEHRACFSVDAKDWSFVVKDLNAGRNPYANPQYHFLNWPPFWMEMLYGLSRVAQPFTWKFYFYLRLVLIAGDVILLASLYWVLGLLDISAPRRPLLLWGYCLNPLLILLTVQHMNFDVFAVIWVVLFLGFLIRFSRGGESADWLAASACLGMGIFTKTFPLILWPLLAPGIRKLDWRTLLLGLGLVMGPAALSLLPLYVLNPELIAQYVIGYRGVGAEFGLLSFAKLAGSTSEQLASYGHLFSKILLGVALILAIFLARRDLRRDADRVLLSALLLLGTFTLGSGYGPQYWFWVMPQLLICYREFGGLFRQCLWIGYWVTIATNVFEYAVVTSLGGFLSIGLDSVPLKHLSGAILTWPRLLPLIRLPMTLGALTVLAVGVTVLCKQRTDA